jgi:hypothetical protein
MTLLSLQALGSNHSASRLGGAQSPKKGDWERNVVALLVIGICVHSSSLTDKSGFS